jgi:hypothetical protein
VGLLNHRRKIFENQEDEVDAPVNFIDGLKKYSRGEIDRYELQDMDESITLIPKNPLGSSLIVIDYENDSDFLKLLDLSEDDMWFESMVNSSYSDYEFMDYSQTKDDFLEGYTVLQYFNEENNEKLKLISDLILPEKEFNLNNEDFRVQFSKLLYDLFEDEVDDIISQFTYDKNSEMTQVAQKTINEELHEPLEKLGFDFYQKYDRISTTITNLRVWALRLGIKDADAMTLVSKIFEDNQSNSNVGGWADMMYEFQDDKYFDDNGFNNYVGGKLDKIIESLEEEIEQGGLTIGEYLNFKNRILKKFEFDTWYKLPKDPKIKFKIDGFDREEIRVIVLINHPIKGVKKLNLTEENFYNLLYQPELFDRFDT